MLKLRLISLVLFSFLFYHNNFAQGTKIVTPKLDFDGQDLKITYDVLNAGQSDKYFVWVEIQKRNGEMLKVKSISGDVGDIVAGANKVITWNPAKDSIFLNEEISVEVKAEKYVKEHNKGSAMMLSILLPGLGQTKMSNGKPFWIMGVASYGALAGGLATYSAYKKSYDSYLLEENDAQSRADHLNKAEKNAAMAGAMLVGAAVLWTANLIWVAATPNRYQPLKYRPVTLVPSADPRNGAALLTFQYKF